MKMRELDGNLYLLCFKKSDADEAPFIVKDLKVAKCFRCHIEIVYSKCMEDLIYSDFNAFLTCADCMSDIVDPPTEM